MEFRGDDILFSKILKISTYLDGGILTISDHPWGFYAGFVEHLCFYSTQATGSVLVHQKMLKAAYSLLTN